jgi:hypothetical protein
MGILNKRRSIIAGMIIAARAAAAATALDSDVEWIPHVS